MQTGCSPLLVDLRGQSSRAVLAGVHQSPICRRSATSCWRGHDGEAFTSETAQGDREFDGGHEELDRAIVIEGSITSQEQVLRGFIKFSSSFTVDNRTAKRCSKPKILREVDHAVRYVHV